MLADERVGGVILSPADRLGSGVEALLGLSIPVVAYDRMLDDDRIDSVVVDNADGVRRATEHLIWLGHERIAFVGGRADTETGAGRLDGYTAAMRGSGRVPFASNGGFRRELAEEEVGALVATPQRPTALVVANNQMTLGALRALRRAGLSVPDDVAVVGVDDAAGAEVVDPPLTTMAQPVREMGRTAMTLLRERIEHRYDGAPRRIVLPLELKVRSSCGITNDRKERA
jgi:DNA-binding LacI/PurR family transcriptional regulator